MSLSGKAERVDAGDDALKNVEATRQETLVASSPAVQPRSSQSLSRSFSLPKPTRSSRRKTKDLLNRLHRTQSMEEDFRSQSHLEEETCHWKSMGHYVRTNGSEGSSSAFSNVIQNQGKYSGTRVSVRVLRQQKKAATTIQTRYRGCRGRRIVRNKRIQTAYLEFAKEQKNMEAWIDEQRFSLVAQLYAMERQTESDLETMRLAVEAEKADFEQKLRDRLEQETAQDSPIADEVFQGMRLKNETEISELKKEQTQLHSELCLWQDLVTGLEQETEELGATNERTRQMFQALNDYAKASLADRRFLEEQARIFNRGEVENTRQQLKICFTYAMAENSAKDLYRSQLYRYVYSLKDSEAFHDIMPILVECEESCGKTVLGPDEVTKLLEPSLDGISIDSDDEGEGDHDILGY